MIFFSALYIQKSVDEFDILDYENIIYNVLYHNNILH